MAEYIVKQAALDLLQDSGDAYATFSTERCIYLTARQKVKNMSAADVVPVIHSRWLIDGPEDEDGNRRYSCQHCHHIDVHSPKIKVPYCWFCGAKMDKEE